MKKIKISELIKKSTYHETVADEELVNAIMKQSKKSLQGGMGVWMKRLIVLAGVVLVGVLAYILFTVLLSDRFYSVTDSSLLSGDTLTGDYNPDWEQELLDNIEAILLDTPGTGDVTNE